MDGSQSYTLVMKNWLKLFRWPNLLMIAATQLLMRHCIIGSILGINHFVLQSSGFEFSILMFATLLIAAGGYAINDYHNTHADRVNKGESIIVGKLLSKQQVLNVYIVLTLSALVGIAWLSFRFNMLSLFSLFCIVSGLLWYYSATNNKVLLAGNIMIAILTGLVPFLVAIVEIPLIHEAFLLILVQNPYAFMPVLWWVTAFSLFAFSLTLLREIVKDLEDMPGDIGSGRTTLPILIGSKVTRIIAVIIAFCIMICLAWCYYRYLRYSTNGIDLISLVYLSVAVIAPLLWSSVILSMHDNVKAYKRVSLLIKTAMLGGMGYAVVFCYIVKTA